MLSSIFIFTITIIANGNNIEISKQIKDYIESYRISEKRPEIKITNEQLKEADPNKILEVLLPYENDSEEFVRRVTHRTLVRIANFHPDNKKVRQEVVMRLTESGFNKTDNEATGLLMEFNSRDFNQQSKYLIRKALDEAKIQKDTSPSFIRLCGIADMKEELPLLKELLIDEKNYEGGIGINKSKLNWINWISSTGWNARLARSRMGVKEDIIKCLELAESIEDPDERVLRILPAIGYIRQPEAIEYLKKYLESNKRLPSETPNTKGSLYALRALHILAACLKNFPVEQKESRGYTQEELDLCRKWMSEQKEWQIIR